MKKSLVATLLMAASTAHLLADGDGPLLGKPLPALELSHSLQGDAWQPNDLLGSVVVLDVFQLG